MSKFSKPLTKTLFDKSFSKEAFGLCTFLGVIMLWNFSFAVKSVYFFVLLEDRSFVSLLLLVVIMLAFKFRKKEGKKNTKTKSNNNKKAKKQSQKKNYD